MAGHVSGRPPAADEIDVVSDDGTVLRVKRADLERAQFANRSSDGAGELGRARLTPLTRAAAPRRAATPTKRNPLLEARARATQLASLASKETNR